MSEIVKSRRSVHRPRRARWLLATVVLATVVLTGSAQATSADHVPHPLRAVDVAIGASASASSAAAGSPASNAVDGSASTAWCATQWTGSVVVDLGGPRTVSGLGVTLGSTASPATASIDLAVTAGAWQPVASAREIALRGNTPSYIPLPHGQTVRYARLTVTTGDGTPACVGEFRLFADTNADLMLGADLSFTGQELAAGTTFTDQGRVATPVQILRSRGGNYVRMRLWVNPPAGYSDLASDLALALAVRAAGMKIYLDIHYSDFWADPQHQITPAVWQGQDLPTLANTVRTYTHGVISAFARQDTPVDMVSIGNEIRNGMLWPTGQVDPTAGTGWDNLATLLKAGIQGARSANPAGHPFRVMLHYDQGGNNATSFQFFHNLVGRGVNFDVIGLSYYTFFHGPVTALRDNVDKLAVQFGKDIVIAETQYAWTLANGDTTGNFVWQAGQLEGGYPAGPGGQLSFLNDLLSILAQVPGGHGAGLFYWEPEWVPSVGWEPGAGTPNDNLTLFDFQGRALPSMGLFENPIQVCQRYDSSDIPCVVP
ncbi:MAG TPA: glycosyl hydrolase 53 family protein [Pseudonocardiaceae bacterium]